MVTEKNGSTHKRVRVLLAHRTRLMLEGMADILRKAGFETVDGVDSEEDLALVAKRRNPDILLLDWTLPKAPLDTVHQLSGPRGSTCAVVLVGQPRSPEDFAEAIQAGARGFLSLDISSEEFVNRLQLLAQGDFVVSRGLLPTLSMQWEASYRAAPTDGLSDREREVLALVSTGATNEEIAQELIITRNTVKVHLRHILDKLDLRNRQQLVVYAVRAELVEGSNAARDKQPQLV